MSILVAWFLIVFGIVHLVRALAGPNVSWWWTQLLLGIAELVGLWAIFIGPPGSSPPSREEGERAEQMIE